MIKINKGTAPQILLKNEAAWTSALLTKIAKGQTLTETELTRYKHHDIKQALVEETHGKCAYCESKFGHISYGDVEHVVAKSRDPAGRFKWTNLTIACDRCNTNKGDAEGFVDPNSDDPKDFFVIFGAMVFPRPDNEKAVITERGLRLNRSELVERGKERLSMLHSLAIIASNAQTNGLFCNFCG
jgi:uncharacterized protein (TIGR02646 family)